MEKSRFFSILEDMWYRIKMWWFLREFGKQINLHTLLEPRQNLSVGGVTTSTSDFFIDGTEQWPGLARRTSKRFSKILWWERKDDPEKIRKKIVEYNDIFSSCVKEGYIYVGTWATNGRIMNALDPTRGEYYDESRGWAGLVQVVGRKFPAVWALIAWVITVIVAVIAYVTKKP